MHEQKVTKLGSWKVHFPKSDQDGVYIWLQNRKWWSRGSERPTTHTQQKLTQVASLPRENKCSYPVLTHLILYNTDPFGHNRITSLVSVISCLRPSLMPGKWVSGTQINLSICGLKASLLEYPVLLYCRRLSIQYWRKYMIVVNSCSNKWKRTQFVQWLLGIRIWIFHFYFSWYFDQKKNRAEWTVRLNKQWRRHFQNTTRGW